MKRMALVRTLHYVKYHPSGRTRDAEVGRQWSRAAPQRPMAARDSRQAHGKYHKRPTVTLARWPKPSLSGGLLGNETRRGLAPVWPASLAECAARSTLASRKGRGSLQNWSNHEVGVPDTGLAGHRMFHGGRRTHRQRPIFRKLRNDVSGPQIAICAGVLRSGYWTD